MRLILLFLAFFFSFNEVIDSTRPDLHLILTSDELRKYLDTDSNDAVPDYDLTQVIHYKGKRSINSPQKNVFLSAFGKHMELKLKHNGDVIANDGLTVERRTSEGLLSKEIHFPKEEFYVGHVTSDPGSHVALREIERKGQLRGAILMDEHFYQLKPLTDDLHERASLNGSGYHVIYRRSVKSIARGRKKASPITVPKKPPSILVQDEPIQQDQDNVSMGPFFIEAMLTADKTTCDFYGNETLDYLLDTANLVSRLYKDPSIGVNVTWVLVKVFLVEGFDPLLDFTTNHVTSASQYLYKFRRWSSIRNTPNGATEHFDLGAFLSRRICGLGDCYLDGLAAYNVPCNDWGVSIDDARGLTAAFTVAHEMAHNLGVGHDSGKDCSGGFIMHSTQSSGPNAFRWSPCSRHRMKEIFRDNICFQNKPPHELPSPPLPPGYLTSRDKQCQMAQGPEFRACPLPALSVSCGPLYCITQGGGSCYSRGAPVAEGTVCGYRKWCRAGECSDVGSGFPAPQDGGWSSWGTYGGCSRTCGGGVKYRSRECNNPQPKYFGKGCKGSSKGHYMMCNTQDCAVENFRQKQCEEHNTESKKYSVHFPGGVRNCKLACASGSKGYYFGDVKDGTRCGQNRYEYDVCIGGICKNVGCDKKLGSAKVYDRCLHCGGNGSSCILSEDTYRKDYRKYGQYSGDTMVIIPQGATNVWIHELGNTINFLSIASNKTGKYYVPIPSWTGTHYAAGTEIYHSMKSYHDAEEIYIRGPTNEALQAKFVYSGRQRNPGVYHIFYSPGIGNGTKFVWRQELKESCSASCAGGIQTIRITCNREDDGSKVSPDYCDISTKPAESIPCNLAPCPKQFEDGVWSVCSKICGGGLQYRNLTCVQVVSKDSTLVLPNSECSHLSKPKTMQECNQIDCLPDWVTGNWTRCSDVCGGGTKSRSVECKKRLRNGELVTLAHADCDGISTEKPVSVMQCISKPCSEWKVQYPCVTCGGLNNMSYVPVGCFRDRNAGVRPLPELLSSYRYHIDWNRVNLMVEKCAQDAWAKQFPVFGVQYYAECWSGRSGYLTYDKDGPNLDGCWQGVGKGWNNYVYAFTNLVVEPVVDCIDTVTNQTITEDLCSSPKPHVRMKLCSQVCSAR